MLRRWRRRRQGYGGYGDYTAATGQGQTASVGDKAETSTIAHEAAGQVKVLFTPIVPLGVLYVAEQYYLAKYGEDLALFLAFAYTNKLFARQIQRPVFAHFTCANTIRK